MRHLNFTQCQIEFKNNATLQEPEHYGWRGLILGLAQNNQTQISRKGCLELCGPGTQFYTWKEVSSTLTTWILPVVGTLLQAPFESNATKRTLLAIARWVGSPIASLSYVLWNIKVSAKAALMVDMAVKYDEFPHRKADFGSMRDSMYLLLVLNQYTLKADVVQRKKEAECLLRIALFSRDLELTDTEKSLREMRRILARELREMRRRGAVPVFVSTMWFLFAFALSVEGAFNDLGQNTTAHDLALGCLLAWFPILIMGSIVDRNPIAAEAIKKKLNSLIDHVRHALHNERHRNQFLNTFRDHHEFKKLQDRVETIANAEENVHDFFEEFAGQARVRWHYGAAHAILSDIEHCYIADKGRNWLADERDARMNLVLGTINEEGLMWFDIREFWQVGSAMLIVGGSCGGAFILSYFTPTVGLGCRSGGYTIFFCIAMGLIILEMTIWLITSPYQVQIPWLRRRVAKLRAIDRFSRWETNLVSKWRDLESRASSWVLKAESWVVSVAVWLASLPPAKYKKARKSRVRDVTEAMFTGLRRMSTQKKWEMFFFRPFEIFNTIWLIYIVLAQTFGWYKTCNCVTSYWGGGGGYLDFGVQDTSNSRWVLYYWTTGTCMSGLVLLLSMFYITVEWCQQSFLSTETYDDAMSGLKMTRRYRSFTYWFRASFRFVSKFTFDPLEALGVNLGLIKTRQHTLVWTKEHTHNPVLPPSRPSQRHAGTRLPPGLPPPPGTSPSPGHPPSPDRPPQPGLPTSSGRPATPGPSSFTGHHASPSIELTDYSNPEYGTHDTPAMAHSLFPPALKPGRPRNQSDASFTESGLPIFDRYRTSNDSNRPLIWRPSDVHRSRAAVGRRPSDEREGRRSSDFAEHRSSSEYMLAPASMYDEQPVFGNWLGSVQSRQGYQRANSDPGSPPILDDGGERGAGQGLGIGMGSHIDERRSRD